MRMEHKTYVFFFKIYLNHFRFSWELEGGGSGGGSGGGWFMSFPHPHSDKVPGTKNSLGLVYFRTPSG
jgi:hypothetical protein